MQNRMYRKLLSRRIWHRVYLERLGEPFCYNFVAIPVMLFGSYRQRIAYDLIPRQPYACGMELASRIAKKYGVTEVIAIEFGVAAGQGLLNLVDIAEHLTSETDIAFRIVGFDAGNGMPAPCDYRDHPELYKAGDYPMYDAKSLQERLPSNAALYIGDVRETVPRFLASLGSEARIGFISVDLDYYSSTANALNVLLHDERHYLPQVVCYFDDIGSIDHNPFCGERLAIEEFNTRHHHRKLAQLSQLRHSRVFQRAPWIDQMFFAHVFDSQYRHPDRLATRKPKAAILRNPYIDLEMT